MSGKEVETDLKWLASVITFRLQNKANNNNFPLPEKLLAKSGYGKFLKNKKLKIKDRLLLITVLTPFLNPQFFDEIIKKNIPEEGDHVFIGGHRSGNFRGFLPTGETVMFLLAGNDFTARLEAWHWLRKESVLVAKNYVDIVRPKTAEEPPQSSAITLTTKVTEEILFGESIAPTFSLEFPAKKMETSQLWSDLILHKETQTQLNELKDWIEHNHEINKWGIGKKIKKGYRSLFYGPPGTGKTLAATLLGKHTNTEVFLVDLSMVVSKYIGETEKNLGNLFKQAQNQNWILFFDEADALFGKRTSVRDAHDKYANQEVSYLLQKVEEFSGLVILASNLKGNIDDAFLRRFQSVIYFPYPGIKERYVIWQKVFEGVPRAAKEIDLQVLAENYELTGSNILNAAHYACLRAVANGTEVLLKDVIYGISKEMRKEGKVV